MTIKVTIEHCEPTSKFDIEVYQVHADKEFGQIGFDKAPPHILKPGQKHYFYVYGTQDLLIKEVL